MIRQAGVLEDVPNRSIAVEFARDHQPLGAAANQVDRPATSRQESERVDEDGFAGAGLAADDGQTRAELEVDVLDDREVLDRQAAEHPPIMDR